MKVGYTEFSYGYAFTENLIRGSNTKPTGAPVFPNLVQEGQGGYDLRIDFPGVPLFFQFKLPEIMKRASAKEIKSGMCGGWSVPFFRIELMRKDISRQHSLLMKLEQANPHCVFYAAALLEDLTAFNDAYSSATVAQRSVLISPTDIGQLPDNKKHTIAYRQTSSTAYFCSEPQLIPVRGFGTLTEDLRHRFLNKSSATLRALAGRLREEIVELASPRMRDRLGALEARIRASREQQGASTGRPSDEINVETKLLVVREVARVDFGIEMVVAQSSP